MASRRNIIRWWCSSYRLYKPYLLLQIKNNLVTLAVWRLPCVLLMLAWKIHPVKYYFVFVTNPSWRTACHLSVTVHSTFLQPLSLFWVSHLTILHIEWVQEMNAVTRSVNIIWWPLSHSMYFGLIQSYNPHLKYSSLPKHNNLLLKLGICLLLLVQTQMNPTYQL